MPRPEHVDVAIIGSGFGGSVAALRLAEKGYRVVVLEAGKRFVESAAQVDGPDTAALPLTSWRLREFLWAPAIGCYGIQRIHQLDDVLVLAGAGVGGGSLNYANTLYRPPPDFYADRQWADIADWADELAPHYDRAERMLGVTDYPTTTPADAAVRAVADRMCVGGTFRQTPVGVFLGAPGVRPGTAVADPFFGGVGPTRRTCTECGECMTGCRHGAKNTLPQNYLYLAERAGVLISPMTTVTTIRPVAGGGFLVGTRRTGGGLNGFGRAGERATSVLSADQVIVAAGTYGTQSFLHRLRGNGSLPLLSARLGALTRTNSESILGAKSRSRDVDYSRGVAITSSFHPDPHTHIEPVRYGHGSNAMGLLQTVLTDGGRHRLLATLAQLLRDPAAAARSMNVRHWSERTVIALVMQSLDNSLTVHGARTSAGRFRLRSEQGHGEPNPAWIPAANEAVRLLAEEIDGDPGGSWAEVFQRPLTAHFLGGAVIGDDAEHGVVDGYHRAFGYDGLHIMDGSTISANLGVNPALTITAQAERAISLWPNKGEPDTRPPAAAGYRRLAPIRPRLPVVPADAPAGFPA